MTREIDAELQRLAAAGYRTLGVACGPPGRLAFIGLIAFGDPPRADSRALLVELLSLGVRTVMITGDAPATAATVARAIGLDGPICPPGKIPDSIGPDRQRPSCDQGRCGRAVSGPVRIQAPCVYRKIATRLKRDGAESLGFCGMGCGRRQHSAPPRKILICFR